MKQPSLCGAAVFLAATLAVSGCAGTTTAAPSAGGDDTSANPDVLTIQLNWFPEANHTAFFVAEANGYYEDAGLAVNIISGSGSGDAIRRVDIGQANLGVADAAVLTNAIRTGTDDKMVMMLADQALVTVFARVDSGITDVADLAGATIGSPPEDSGRLLIPLLAESAGFDADSVEYVDIKPENKYAIFGSGGVDAVFDSKPNAVLLAKAVGGRQNLTVLPFADNGVDLYAHAIFGQSEWLAANEDVVKRFLEATQKGWAFTIESPGEAVDLFAIRNPQVDKADFSEQLAEQIKLMCTPNYIENGIGHIDPDKMQSTLDIVQNTFSSAEGAVDIESVDEIMTNEYLGDVAMPTCTP